MKVFFTDFWVGLDQTNNFLYNALSKKYSLEIDKDNPDVLFFSCYGNHHLQYKNCIKVYYTGENDTPNFSWCDYAMGFDEIVFGDRYLRLPQYAIQPRFPELFREQSLSESLFNRRFCNFVYSNNDANPLRNAFFHYLSNYKRVDSGGRVENNIGGPVDNKLAFISNYKFTIAFENSAYPGYTTEKLVEPMICKSIPIYWGNPLVDNDFNVDAFVWIKDKDGFDSALEEIKYLDENKAAYLKKLSTPKLKNSRYQDTEGLILAFLGHIFEQTTESSKRRPGYGFTADHYSDFVLGLVNWDSIRYPEVKESSKKKDAIKRVKKVIKKVIKR